MDNFVVSVCEDPRAALYISNRAKLIFLFPQRWQESQAPPEEVPEVSSKPGKWFCNKCLK